MARIISIVNQKGGTGKSACTANLAVGLAQKNMKVLIVDADPQSDVSAGFGYRDCDDSNETLTVLMDAVMKDEDIPSDCYIRHQAEGIDIICSNIGLAGTEVQLVNAMSREYVLKQILYGIKDQYDAVIIDCMPSLGMITINALAASDEVLIPVEASYLPIKGFIPLLRADFEMDEKYLRKNKVKLECSINAFCGENDTEATETDMQEWGEYTSDFALEVFAGDHFFIKSNAKTVQSLNEIIKRNI